MQLEQEKISLEEKELAQMNIQLSERAAKFGAQFIPLSLGELKMFKIRKATETGNVGYLETILLEEITDLQERKIKIQQRLANFYPQIKVQSGDKYFAEKQVPDFTEDSTVIRDTAWYLFGVDYMSNQKIRHYFSTNPHFRIEWLNDSSCNIVFNSREEALSAIEPCKKGGQMLDENEIWYELNEYEVDGVLRKLYCRIATNKDVKKVDTTGRNSEYYKWVKTKHKLGNHVKRVAQKEIMKTKAISKDLLYKSRIEKFHKQKREEEASSSGVDDSEDKMAD